MSPGARSIGTEALVKVYGEREVVRGVDVHVNAGEIVGLLGPNGAGKTTCFYMIVGLVAATRGKVLFDGRDITQMPMYKRARLGIGYLPQEASVFRKLTVEDNIKCILETLPLSKKEIREQLESALEGLGLTKVAKQKAYTLSGGERRRLEITRALVTHPQFLLMDEPFSGVDPISVQEVQQIIRDLKLKNMGILITDHNVRETLRVVDRAYLLYDGRILCAGTSDHLIPGVVKGIGFAINFFSNPGDKVVIQPPVYHPFRMVTEGNDRVVIQNPLIRTGDSYRMDLEGLERIARTDKPRMMILCNPHNPIGLQWDMDTLREVARIARENDMTVVSDEIHGDLMLDKRRHIPFLATGEDARAVGVMLGAPSKTFNIPGMVSSWCVIKNPDLRIPFFRWLDSNEFNAPTFTATIATETAYHYGEAWLDEVLVYIKENIDFTRNYLETYLPSIGMITPEASFLVWLDCRSLGLDQQQLVSLFINRAHLALNDGSMFGDEGRGFMRLNVGCPRSVLRLALDHLRDALS